MTNVKPVEIKGKFCTAICYANVIEDEAIGQIRRMCAAFGYEVKKMKRIRIMDLTLRGLKPGQYREIELSELGLREEDMEADKQ